MEKLQLRAEHSVIGCILHGTNDAEIFMDMSEHDFTDPDCRALFVSLRDYWAQYKTVDIACVPKQYTELALKCYDFMPSASNWKAYIATAKKDAAKERIRNLAFGLVSGDYEPEEAEEVIGEMAKASQGEQRVRRMGMRQALDNFWEEQQKEPSFIKTGYEKLNEATFFERGDYVVIGARPSTGKTAFALKLARELAKQGIKTAFYSYETTIEKLTSRTIAAHCDISLHDIKRRSIETEKAEHLGEDLAWFPLDIIEAAGKSIRWIKADVIKNRYEAVFIDYIGLVPSDGRDRFEKVTNTSMAIRDLCQSTGVIAFALAQINREGRKAPSMEDLKESGQIEQDADAIMLLHNETDIAERHSPQSSIQLILAKNKEGECGCINMIFDGSKQNFWEVSPREYH